MRTTYQLPRSIGVADHDLGFSFISKHMSADYGCCFCHCDGTGGFHSSRVFAPLLLLQDGHAGLRFGDRCSITPTCPNLPCQNNQSL